MWIKKAGIVAVIFACSVSLLCIRVEVLAQGRACGNGVCQSSLGEDSASCPADCGPAPTPEPPQPPQPTQPPGDNGSGDSGSNSGTPGSGDSGATSGSSDTSAGSSSPAEVKPTYYPSITLNSPKSPTNNTSPVYTGTAAIEADGIRRVEYSVTQGASWLPVNSADGAFDSNAENFTFALPNLAEAEYSVWVRALSGQGNYTQSGSYARNNILIVTTPPVINFPKFAEPITNNITPTITAQVTSRLATVQRVELSLDGGLTWERMTGLGSRYSFTAPELDDGNYAVLIRAFDNAGNLAISDTQELIIDTVPPVIGGSQYAVGPQLLQPNNAGIIELVAGAKTRLVLSMRGGVTNATVNTGESQFPLQQESGTHLWFADLLFDTPGEQKLTVHAIDGAGNESERSIGRLIVQQSGTITTASQPVGVADATVTVYYYQNKTRQWLVWDGAAFGQNNPQVTSGSGNYAYLLPPGKYYLEVKKIGLQRSQSKIFTLVESSSVNFDITVPEKAVFTVQIPLLGEKQFSLPGVLPHTVSTPEFSTKPKTTASLASHLQGKTAPDLTVLNMQGDEVTLTDYAGKKILLSFVAPWSAPAMEQSGVFSELQARLADNEALMVIALQESVPTVDTFLKRGAYQFPLFADKNGESGTAYEVSLLPQHFFIDSQGVVREVVVGQLSSDLALEKLGKLP